jgi:hypothetical protein
MNNRIFAFITIATLSAGCTWVPANKNPNRIQNPEKDAYSACLKKNNGDKSKCAAERQQYLDRQEMELMDNNG